MKTEVAKLRSIVKKYEKKESKQAAIMVYLSVVLLNNTIDDVASFFGLPYNKVRYGVSVLHKKLNSKSCSKFYLQMHVIFKEYNTVNQLKLVA